MYKQTFLSFSLNIIFHIMYKQPSLSLSLPLSLSLSISISLSLSHPWRGVKNFDSIVYTPPLSRIYISKTWADRGVKKTPTPISQNHNLSTQTNTHTNTQCYRPTDWRDVNNFDSIIYTPPLSRICLLYTSPSPRD